MKILTTALFFLTINCVAQENGYYMLPDGMYTVHFNYPRCPDSQLRINNYFYSKIYQNGDSSKGQIKWRYNELFQFKEDALKSDSSVSALKKFYKMFGEPCVELQGRNGDTIMFQTYIPDCPPLVHDNGYFIAWQKSEIKDCFLHREVCFPLLYREKGVVFSKDYSVSIKIRNKKCRFTPTDNDL